MRQLSIHTEMTALRGRPQYIIEDYSFDFKMAGDDEFNVRTGLLGTTSIAIGTLQIELSVQTHICLFAWGYCPYSCWAAASLCTPSHIEGALMVQDTHLVAGVSVSVGMPAQPTTRFDPHSGWFCIGDPGISQDASAVEFATDTIAVVSMGKLVSLWIRPDNWNEVSRTVVQHPS